MIKAKAEALRTSRIERGWDMTKLAQEAKVTTGDNQPRGAGQFNLPFNSKASRRRTRETRRRAVRYIVKEAAT